MGFFAAIVVALVMAVVGELLRPKVKPNNAKASSLDDFDIPTAEEGRSLQIFAGKVKIDGSNVVWYGDLSTKAIKKKVKTGWFSSATQILGYKYRLGLDMVCGWGREDTEIHEIRFGDAMPKHTRTDEANGVVRFDFLDETFYGGPEKEGGVTGTVRFYLGTDAQTSSAYMSAQVEETYPAYKGLSHAVFEHVYLGTSSYIKPVSFIVSSYPNQLGVASGHHIIGEDCNPACFMYEVMTNQVWGVGLSPTDIDADQFRAVAETLFDEGYGMSMLYNGGSTGKDIIEDILRHIDGVMFSSPQTGLITLRLARADYDVDTLPVLTKRDFQEGIKFSRPSWSELRNTIKTTYMDREANYTVAVVSQQDLANITQRGGEIAMEEIDFTGFTAYLPAALATARAMKTLSYPLGKVAGSVSRKLWKTEPGDVFKVDWPERGLNMVVFRVIMVNYTNLSRNVIDLELVEDIFAISRIAYIEPNPSGWEDPVQAPEALSHQRVEEAPAFNAKDDARYIITMGSKDNENDVAYDAWTDPAGGTAFAYSGSTEMYTPSGTLMADYPADAADQNSGGFLVTNMLNADELDKGSGDGSSSRLEGYNLAIIGNEWFAWRDFSIDSMTGDYQFYGVWHAVLDTVPQDHVIGDRVWFISEAAGLTTTDGYSSNLTVNTKLLPRNIRESLALGDATAMSLTLVNRAARPAPPGDPRVGSSRFVDVAAATGVVTVSWKHRNRMHNQIVPLDTTSIEPEAGTLYNLRIYVDATNVLIVERLNMNAITCTFNLITSQTIRIELSSQNGALQSYQSHKAVIAYTNAGAVADVIVADEPEYILDGGGA